MSAEKDRFRRGKVVARVEVLQHHIDQGEPQNDGTCALALAARAVHLEVARIGYRYLEVCIYEDSKEWPDVVEFEIDHALMYWLTRFDEGRRVRPVELVLRRDGDGDGTVTIGPLRQRQLFAPAVEVAS